MSTKYKFHDQDQLYLYSSARNYYGLPGLIDITLVEPMVQ